MSTQIQTEKQEPPQTQHKIEVSSSEISDIWKYLRMIRCQFVQSGVSLTK